MLHHNQTQIAIARYEGRGSQVYVERFPDGGAILQLSRQEAAYCIAQREQKYSDFL